MIVNFKFKNKILKGRVFKVRSEFSKFSLKALNHKDTEILYNNQILLLVNNGQSKKQCLKVYILKFAFMT